MSPTLTWAKEQSYVFKERKTELENKVSLTLAPWNLDVLYLNSRELLQCSQSKGVDTRNYVTVLPYDRGTIPFSLAGLVLGLLLRDI